LPTDTMFARLGPLHPRLHRFSKQTGAAVGRAEGTTVGGTVVGVNVVGVAVVGAAVVGVLVGDVVGDFVGGAQTLSSSQRGSLTLSTLK
jgi:hypothetical protein